MITEFLDKMGLQLELSVKDKQALKSGACPESVKATLHEAHSKAEQLLKDTSHSVLHTYIFISLHM